MIVGTQPSGGPGAMPGPVGVAASVPFGCSASPSVGTNSELDGPAARPENHNKNSSSQRPPNQRPPFFWGRKRRSLPPMYECTQVVFSPPCTPDGGFTMSRTGWITRISLSEYRLTAVMAVLALMCLVTGCAQQAVKT